MTRAVIIGTGPAGITAAEVLRGLQPSAPVLILSAEPYPPYSPPALADHFLTGRDTTLYWKGPDVAARLGIDERREAIVTAVDTDNREIHLAGDERIPYQTLVIASGSRLYAPLVGSDLPGVLDFKSLRTATELVGRVRRGEAASALIVGNGFIGVELSLLLSDLGVDVTVVGRRPWVMPRALDRDTSSVVEAALVQRGVTLRLGVEADAFLGDASVSGVRLASGQVLTADLYIAATGVKPHVEFLEGSGIGTDWGVHVDDRLRTTAPGVYAAGDVAEAADWLTGERYVHAIFPNAVAQARVAAQNAAGRDVIFPGSEALNSLKHLGVPVMAMGTTEGADRTLQWREGSVLRTLYLRDGRIIGAQLAGSSHSAGLYHALMMRQQDVSRFGSRLVEPGFSMADVVWDAMGAPVAALA